MNEYPDLSLFLQNLWLRENDIGLKAIEGKGGYSNGKYYPYKTSNGNIDVGPGFDMDKQTPEFRKRAAEGFTKEELDNMVLDIARNELPYFRKRIIREGGNPDKVTDAVYNGLLDMYWQLKNGLYGYDKFWRAVASGDYEGMRNESATYYLPKNGNIPKDAIVKDGKILDTGRWDFRKDNYFKDPETLNNIVNDAVVQTSPIMEPVFDRSMYVEQPNVIRDYKPVVFPSDARMDVRKGMQDKIDFNNFMDSIRIQNNLQTYNPPIQFNNGEATESNQYDKGGSLKFPQWDNLSVKEKADIMKVAISNGITNLNDIRQQYNEFAEGGDTNPPIKTTGGAGYFPEQPPFIRELNLPRSMEEARLRLYNQVSPVWGFTDDTVESAMQTLLYNKGKWPKEEAIVKDPYVDGVWAEYLQIPENKRRSKYKLEHSSYAPTQGSVASEYYKIPIDDETEDTLVAEGMKLPLGKNKLSTTLEGYNHGEHTVGNGVDPIKGQYVSYYDKWDLNPVTSRYSDWSLKNKDNVLAKLLNRNNGEDSSFGIGKPLRFYDRIYLDDYYGVNSAPGIDTYYGGYLPEVTVDNFGPYSTVTAGDFTEYGVGNRKAKGGSIRIKPSHRGRLTKLKKRTGKTESELYNDGNPAHRKMVVFARNARKWHDLGGNLFDIGGPQNPPIKTTGGAGYVSAIDTSSLLKNVRTRLYNTINPLSSYYIPEAVENFVSGEPFEYDYLTPYKEIVDDIWAEYLNIPEDQRRFKTRLEQSAYRPGMKGNSNLNYYKLPLTDYDKDKLIEETNYLPVGKNIISDYLAKYNLGDHTIGRGFDNKGEYVSYYDRWDLNPFNGKYDGLNIPIINSFSDTSMGVRHPIEIYDRIYLDDYYGMPKNAPKSLYLPEVTIGTRKDDTPEGIQVPYRPYAKGGNLFDIGGPTERDVERLFWENKMDAAKAALEQVNKNKPKKAPTPIIDRQLPELLVFPERSQGEITPVTGNTLSRAINNYTGELKYDLANNKVPGGKYTLPAAVLGATGVTGLAKAGEMAYAAGATPLIMEGMNVPFVASGLDNLIHGNADWQTALEIAPLAGYAKPMWNAGRAAYNTGKNALMPKNIANVTTPPETIYKIKHYPGYQLKSLMSGNPLEKQISKSGTISVNSIKAHIGKGSNVEKAVVDKVLSSEQFADKKVIDYNDFRKAVQERLITYDRVPDTGFQEYGLAGLGYHETNKVPHGMSYKELEEMALAKDPDLYFDPNVGPQGLVMSKKTGRDVDAGRLLDAVYGPNPNLQTYTFESPRIPFGNAKHYNKGTLGHSRTYTTPEDPNILHVMESQSDWAQNKPSNLLKDYDIKSLKDWEEEMAFQKVNAGEGFKGVDYKEEMKKLEAAKAFVDPETSYLANNYLQRQLQENLKYAAEHGQTKMRYPTSDTAAKIEGYSKERVPTEEYKAIQKEFEELLLGNEGAINTWPIELQKKANEYEKTLAYLDSSNKGFVEEYKPAYKTILKKYEDFPKQYRKLYKNAEIRTVTDRKGNTWYEVDVPENYLNQEWQYALGGNLYPKGGPINPFAQKAIKYFMDRGFTDYQAAGLVGNLMRESSMDPNAVNRWSNAFGLAQWLGERKAALFAMYGPKPTFEQQLDFIWHELNTTHKNGLEYLMASRNAEEAARNAMGYYEFSAGPEGAIAAMNKHKQDGQASMDKGIAFANQFYGYYNPKPVVAEVPEPSSRRQSTFGINPVDNTYVEKPRYYDIPMSTPVNEQYSAEALARQQASDNINTLATILGMMDTRSQNPLNNVLQYLV